MATAPTTLRRGQLRLGRGLSVALLLTLAGFSPSLAPSIVRLLNPASTTRIALAPAPADAATTRAVQGYARVAQAFQSALDEVQPGERRRLTLSEQHFQLYLQTQAVLGPARGAALLSMLDSEIRNQNPARSRRSVFASPEAALDNVQTWLSYLAWATAPGTRHRLAVLQVNAPAPLSPRVVLSNRQGILQAAHAAHLAPGLLAAIVDNEQSGQQVAYGLAGVLRELTDTVALRTTEAYGESGWTGDLSQTVGLTQMSWQDALRQRPRFHQLGMQLDRPFPENEAEVRAALNDPDSNLLLAASRLVGYLDQAEGADQRPHTSASTFVSGPGWHNNPALASSGQTWPYAWNGFFKACLYSSLLQR
ncbi:hypothetical protein [Deinococcus sonorensis]|uniref:Uncharacterized protein n=2 Tax=Deinococcus sonorensis TaxID=309891 RepID=A0AAU7U8T5_9DEIO